MATTPTRCIPNSSGSGGIDWLTSPVGTQLLKNIDDAWWIGSLRDHLGGSGSIPHVVFQAQLISSGGGQFVDLSWHIKFDAENGINTTRDAVVVCFVLSTGQPVILKIKPSLASAVDSGGAANFTTTMLRWNGTIWDSAAEPAWMDTNTRIWTQPGGVAPAVTTSQWAVQMRVPIGAEPNGLPLANPFRMWYCAHVWGGIAPERYPMPPGLGTVNVTADLYPPPSSGIFYSLNTAAPGFSCGANVTLDYYDIGTTNPNSHQIKLAPALNEFFIKPKNETGAPIDPGRINATIRLHNWGAAFAGTSLTDWRQITLDPTIPNNPVPHGPISNGAKGTITIKWRPTASESDIYQQEPNQCIIVEMQDTAGTDLNFVPRWRMRNMQFVPASTFQDVAEINIRNIPAMRNVLIPPPQRDTYLYVERLNMPTDYRRVGGIDLRRDSAIQIPGILQEFRRQESPLFRMFDLLKFESLEQFAWEDIAAFLPTYRVHAFYDTGDRQTHDGEVFPVLESLSTFGYYVDHEGPITGWDTRLQGAEKLTDNWYIIRVPENGFVKVRPIIRAVDPSNPEEPLPVEPIVPRPRYLPDTPDLPDGCPAMIISVLKALFRFLAVLFKPLLDQINRKP